MQGNFEPKLRKNICLVCLVLLKGHKQEDSLFYFWGSFYFCLQHLNIVFLPCKLKLKTRSNLKHFPLNRHIQPTGKKKNSNKSYYPENCFSHNLNQLLLQQKVLLAYILLLFTFFLFMRRWRDEEKKLMMIIIMRWDSFEGVCGSKFLLLFNFFVRL